MFLKNKLPKTPKCTETKTEKLKPKTPTSWPALNPKSTSNHPLNSSIFLNLMKMPKSKEE
jgi:hypothetical protein